MTDAPASTTPAQHPAGATSTADDGGDPADRWAARFEKPAFVAALAAIPATFLTLAEGTLGATGQVVNGLSAAVLVAEGAVLFLASRDRRAWVRRNWWMLATIAIIVPATIFAVGPAQLLRLVRSLGALRVLRVRRIIKAGSVASDRLGLSSTWRRVIVGIVSVASAIFVAVVLTDPSGSQIEWINDVTDAVGTVGVVVAGALLGLATFLVVRDRADNED